MDTLIQVPKAPSKFDIIPVHASDRGSFKSCRRKWNWSSPMRGNLMPRPEEAGIYMPFWFGSGIHWAMKNYYDPLIQRDLVETFKTWWDIQWNGGLIPADWLEITYDRNPKPMFKTQEEADRYNEDKSLEPEFYRVKGLEDMLPMAEIEREKFEEHLDLGVGMLTYYRDWCKVNDTFTVIAAEHTFSIPIYDPVADDIMRRIDFRDGIEKEVHLRGTQDAIIQGNNTGLFGILEHKSAVDITEDYFKKLDKDEQCTTYMFAASVEANIHNLPYTKIDFVLYNAIRKAYPKPPTITSRGNISIDRTKESTTYPMLMQMIEDLGMGDFWQLDEKLKSYVEYVKEIGEKQFIVREPVYRNAHELRSLGERVYFEARDMLDPNLSMYPNPTGDRSCLNCIFRAPCIAMDDGSDWEMMIEDQFQKNWTR